MKLYFYGCLVFRALALAVLSQALQGLIDQSYILLIDVEPRDLWKGEEKKKNSATLGRLLSKTKQTFQRFKGKKIQKIVIIQKNNQKKIAKNQ